jgi:hypothetical protein
MLLTEVLVPQIMGVTVTPLMHFVENGPVKLKTLETVVIVNQLKFQFPCC